jgi:hypothetical protein
MAAPFNKSNGTAQQHVTKIVFLTLMYLVTLKAGAGHELFFNKPTSRWQHPLTGQMEQHNNV